MPASITVILDLDGTLIDTSARHYAVYCTLAHQFGLSPLPFEVYWHTRRQGLSNLEALKENGLRLPCYSAAREGWLAGIEAPEALRQDQLFPGVALWLEINQAAVDFVLVTLRSQAEPLFAQLDWLNLSSFFKKILVVPHQPEPHLAKASAVREVINGPVLTWIGDSEVDMFAAKTMGVPAVGVTSGMRLARELLAAGACRVFDKVTQVNLLNLALEKANL